MREIKVKLYQFNELSERAKEKARQWFREGYTGEFAWEDIQEDAEQIGLKIMELDQHRANHGKFIESAPECAEKIIKNHGESCETYKTAKTFLTERDEIVSEAERDENGDLADESALDDALDELESEFLRSLLEDYRIMLEKEYEYQNSDEYVDEGITANEYEFTEDGARARASKTEVPS